MKDFRPARALLCAFVASWMLSGVVVTARAQEGVDVVFMVDTSNFVSDSDPASSRLAVAHGVVDSMRNRGSQRIGVLELTGDAKADPGSWATLQLTALPEDPAEVSAFLDSTVHPALAGLGSDGACLPLNVAVEKHLAEMLKDRGPASRPLWLVMLTHGEADPSGPDGRSEYDWLTPDVWSKFENPGPGEPERFRDEATRPQLKAAARSLFVERFPMQLESLGDNVVLSIVDVNADPNSAGEVIQAQIGDQEVPFLASVTDSEVLNLDGTNVREVIEQLMLQAPFPEAQVPPGVIVQDLADATTQEFRIYQGTRLAWVTLLADHADYTAELSYPEDSSREGFYSTLGQGRLGRSLDLIEPPYGLLELKISTPSNAAPLNLLAMLHFKLDLSVEGRTPEDGEVHSVGSKLDLSVRLFDNVSGETLTDTHLLEGGRAFSTWTSPANPESEDNWAPAADEIHRHTYTHTTVTDGQVSFPWAAEASLLPSDGGGFAWTGSDAGSLLTRFATPELTITFASADEGASYADGALVFEPEWISGDVTTQATLLITVDLHGARGKVPVTLNFEHAAGYTTANASDAVNAELTLDGSPVVNGSQVPFVDSKPLELTIKVSKSGIPPFGGSIGTIVAELDSHDSPKKSVELSMAPTIGPTTMMSLVALLAALVLLALMIRKRMQSAAYRGFITSLTDDQVIYFNDNEPEAPARGVAA